MTLGQRNATEEVVDAAKALNEYPGVWKDHSDAKLTELMVELREALRVYDISQAGGS